MNTMEFLDLAVTVFMVAFFGGAIAVVLCMIGEKVRSILDIKRRKG